MPYKYLTQIATTQVEMHNRDFSSVPCLGSSLGMLTVEHEYDPGQQIMSGYYRVQRRV